MKYECTQYGIVGIEIIESGVVFLSDMLFVRSVKLLSLYSILSGKSRLMKSLCSVCVCDPRKIFNQLIDHYEIWY
jgi:hypothetical protein